MTKTVKFSKEYAGLTQPFRELTLDFDLVTGEELPEILTQYYEQSPEDQTEGEALFPAGSTLFKFCIAERASGGAAECDDFRRMKLFDGQKLSRAVDEYLDSADFDRAGGVLRWEDGEITLKYDELSSDDLIRAEHTAGGNVKGWGRLMNLRYLFAVAASAAGMKIDEMLALPFCVLVTVMEQTRLFFLLGDSATTEKAQEESSEETA